MSSKLVQRGFAWVVWAYHSDTTSLIAVAYIFTYQIPSLLLDKHGGAFRDMVDLCKGSDPIVLQDSEAAFEAFFDAMTM